MNSVSQKLFHLIGFPGVGKRTIAEAMSRQEPSIVVDNIHINRPLIDVIGEDYDPSLPRINALKWPIKQAQLQAMIEFGAHDHHYIFTNYFEKKQNNDGIEQWWSALKNAAQEMSYQYHMIRLLCDENENRKRAGTTERQKPKKLTDRAKIQQIRSQDQLYVAPLGEDYLDIDITNLSPTESAIQIFAHFGL